MEAFIRSFIALDLDPTFLKTIEETLQKLQELKCHIKWVPAKNMHITLKFLGNIKESQLSELKSLIQSSLKGTRPLSYNLTELGAFPSIKKPRIIWIGLRDPNDQIKKLAQELEANLESLGIAKEEKPFHPHITLGRTKTNENIRELSEIIGSYKKFDLQKKTFDHVTLYKSTLSSLGPIYEVLETFRL